MNGPKLRLFTLIFLFGATILVPVLLPAIATADCGAHVRDYDRGSSGSDLLSCDNSAVRDCERCNVRDCVTCDDRDYDRPVARNGYRCNAIDYNRTSVCDYDRSAVRDYDRSSVRDCDYYPIRYGCDIYGCYWVPVY